MKQSSLQRLVEDIDNQEFIYYNMRKQVPELLFKYGQDPDKKALISQIAARQRMAKKLPQWVANFALLFPPKVSQEQCSSESTARLKASLLKGNHLVDMTGGFGVDVYYLSQSFKRSTVIERSEELTDIMKYNFKELNSNIEVLQGDSAEMISTIKADTLYLDPSRRDSHNRKMVSIADCEPNILEHRDNLLASSPCVIIKLSPLIDIQETINSLQNVKEVWVISYRNECKEVVVKMTNQTEENPLLRCFNVIRNNQYSGYEFRWKDKAVQAACEMPMEYLYEPNASIMKSGGYNVLARDHQLFKLHPNSNFYTSDQLRSNFPGKVFRLVKVRKAYDKSLKKGAFNIISRNFPDNAEKIAGKLSIKPAKVDFLLATRLKNEEYSFLEAQLINQ